MQPKDYYNIFVELIGNWLQGPGFSVVKCHLRQIGHKLVGSQVVVLDGGEVHMYTIIPSPPHPLCKTPMTFTSKWKLQHAHVNFKCKLKH